MNNLNTDAIDKELIKSDLHSFYNIDCIHDVQTIAGGSAGCYMANTGKTKYFVKIFQGDYNIDSVRREPLVRNVVYKFGIPTPQILLSQSGESFASIRDRIIQVQPYIHGITYKNNEVKKELINSLARLLANCNDALRGMNLLFPTNFYSQWFDKNRTKSKMKELNLLRTKKLDIFSFPERFIQEDLEFKKEALLRVSSFSFDIDKFSIGPHSR